MEESTLRWPTDKEREEMKEVCSIGELRPVSTGMGDCLQAGKLSHYVTSHLGQLSLAICRLRNDLYCVEWDVKL